MIQIYKLENQDYEKNGDMTLFPSSCDVYAELNGSWYVEMKHPIDKLGRWKYIVDNAVVKAPSFNGDQLFRIKTKYKSDSGIEVRMEPIFYDAMSDCWLTDVRPTGKNGQEALNIMLQSNSKYSAESDIKKTNTAYYQYLNFFEALNGNIDQSFINRWGGEILYDNFKIIVNEKIGEDQGVELLYGKNIKKDGLSEDIDTSSVITRIYPKAYNGKTMSGDGYVDSPLINNYPVIHIVTMTFDDVKLKEDAQEDDEDNGITVCENQEELDTELRKRCETQFEEGIDKPKVSIEADLVMLSGTKQYRDYKMLETVSLGDTIHCKHIKLGIETSARITAIVYSSILKRVTSVTIGEYEDNYFDNVSSAVNRIDSVVNSDGSLVAERVKGILDGMNTQLKLQSTAAKKVDGVAFKVEDLDEKSDLYGCMIWGTQGIQISSKRNTSDTDWVWTTAITSKGINADAILTGLLSDREGKNYWDLETGEFHLSADAFGYDTTTNLIQNGTFDQGLYKWMSGNGADSKYDLGGDARCAELPWLDGNAGYIYQTFENIPAGKYKLSFKARSTSTVTTGDKILLAFLGRGQYVNVTNSSYETFEIEFSIESEKERASIRFTNSSNKVSTIEIDDVELYGPSYYNLSNEIKITAAGLEAEIVRAKDEEEILRNKITVNAEGLQAEIERATDQEGYLKTQLELTANGLKLEVSRAKEQEGLLSSAITVNAESIKTKVTSSQVESIIEQKADSIRLKASKISWISDYSSMTEDGKLYCSGIVADGTFESYTTNGSVNMRDGRLNLTYNGEPLGGLGSQFWKDTSYTGIAVDLNYEHDFLGLSAQNAVGSLYYFKWVYSRVTHDGITANHLNAGCDVDMHYYKLKNVNWPDGSITSTLRFIQPLSVNSDGTLSRWANAELEFKNGILIRGAWNNG